MIAITILTTTIPICAKIETSLFAKYPPANNKITYAAPPTRIDTSQLRAAPAHRFSLRRKEHKEQDKEHKKGE